MNLNATVPTIDLERITLVQSINESEDYKDAAKLFLEHGCMILKNVFRTKYLKELFDQYLIENKQHFEDGMHPDWLIVGDKRSQISVVLKGPFNTSYLYANPKIFPLLKYLLGEELILASLGSVVALPGAEDQHIHRDHPNIYETIDYFGAANSVIHAGPPYAITVIIPLVPINNVNGNTRLWPGTHLTRESVTEASVRSGVDYVIDVGSCLLMDYRLIHSGVGNRSDSIRPILYNVYSRPWFRDYRNYSKHKPITVPDDEYQQIPDRYRSLFDWAVSYD